MARPKTGKIITKDFPTVKIVRGDVYEGDKFFGGELKDDLERPKLCNFDPGIYCVLRVEQVTAIDRMK